MYFISCFINLIIFSVSINFIPFSVSINFIHCFCYKFLLYLFSVSFSSLFLIYQPPLPPDTFFTFLFQSSFLFLIFSLPLDPRFISPSALHSLLANLSNVNRSDARTQIGRKGQDEGDHGRDPFERVCRPHLSACGCVGVREGEG